MLHLSYLGRIVSIVLWKIADAEATPNGSQVYWYNPWCVVMVVTPWCVVMVVSSLVCSDGGQLLGV